MKKTILKIMMLIEIKTIKNLNNIEKNIMIRSKNKKNEYIIFFN